MIEYTTIPVTLFEQNCSIVWCTKTLKAAVVDPGGDIQKILSAVHKNCVTVEKILITHGHVDHAGGAAELGQLLSVPIEGPHIDDAFWIEQIPEQTIQFSLPMGKSFVPSRWLNDGDTLTVGEIKFNVLHCPGHTPGHVVFHQPEEKIAIVGDVLFHGSIGRTDFPRGNHEDLLSSIVKKLWPLGKNITFLPGHGPISTFERERRDNPFVRDSIIFS